MNQQSLFDKYQQEPAQDMRAKLGFREATYADLETLTAQKCAILLFIRGTRRTNRELIQHTGATEAMRRVRELRAAGYVIEKRKASDSARNIEYRWNGKRK